ncbi:DUF4190 domain-containing protein [Amycolatopsis jejuensis]|uniref:DUF4190 domain-containing protein n=1 Tax=Amycolatopsis jejuensis TaxID=330084 RepID=UPI0005255C8B|nr:DUF4190 domain-containing protein [Amycolatopsis jejuensis]
MTTPPDRDPLGPLDPPPDANPFAPPAPATPPPGWTAPPPAPGSYDIPSPDPVAHIPGAYAPPPGYPPPYPQPGQPYPPYAPTYQGYQPYGRQDDTGLAVGALVCSVIGLVTFLLAIPGIIMGHIALAKADRGEAGGRGMALAAVVIGYTVVALYVGFFVTLVVLGVNGYLDR